jgi:hypothetical protein
MGDQNKAAINAVLASHLLARLDRQQKQNIATLIVDQILKSRYRATAEDVLRKLNNNCRVTQMNFIALACNDLGIEPPIPKSCWLPIRNPYSVGGHTKETDISSTVRWFARRNGVSINWPGDEVKVDFLGWYGRPSGCETKSRREFDGAAQRGSEGIKRLQSAERLFE